MSSEAQRVIKSVGPSLNVVQAFAAQARQLSDTVDSSGLTSLTSTARQIAEQNSATTAAIKSTQVEALRLFADQTSWQRDMANWPGLTSLTSTAARITEQYATTKSITAGWASEMGASISALQSALPDWPTPVMAQSLSAIATQTAQMAEAIAQGLGSAQLDVDFRSDVDVDVDLIDKIAHLPADQRSELLNDVDDDAVLDEVVTEIATDLEVETADVRRARDLLLAAAFIVFNSTPAEVLALVNDVEDLIDAMPGLKLIGLILTVRSLYNWLAPAEPRAGTTQGELDSD